MKSTQNKELINLKRREKEQYAKKKIEGLVEKGILLDPNTINIHDYRTKNKLIMRIQKEIDSVLKNKLNRDYYDYPEKCLCRCSKAIKVVQEYFDNLQKDLYEDYNS